MRYKFVVLVAVAPLLLVGACSREGAAGQQEGAPEAASSSPTVEGEAPPPGHRYRLDYRPEMIGRVYDTDFGQMIIDRYDTEGAAGRYSGQETDGAGAGTFDGVVQPADDPVAGHDRLEGFWYAPTGAQPCDEPRNGTRFWGRIQFNFARDSNDFIGFYGHCEGAPLDRWNGAFVRRDPVIAAAVVAQMP
ncbi:MAG: hypothetical protein KF910_09180 [Brevundimonas sp.]|uniref:hypothetical protein n=1 Tax=Brevundimonas sp. TaxID=1871086 RepID=UPI0025BD9851|nr:hypothetical protein [Brevundimonas sp.]MBX3477769.1 hypothetical protein [Brevundimonas sp.]